MSLERRLAALEGRAAPAGARVIDTLSDLVYWLEPDPAVPVVLSARFAAFLDELEARRAAELEELARLEGRYDLAPDEVWRLEELRTVYRAER